jgi:hypothetical protein
MVGQQVRLWCRTSCGLHERGGGQQLSSGGAIASSKVCKSLQAVCVFLLCEPVHCAAQPGVVQPLPSEMAHCRTHITWVCCAFQPDVFLPLHSTLDRRAVRVQHSVLKLPEPEYQHLAVLGRTSRDLLIELAGNSLGLG